MNPFLARSTDFPAGRQDTVLFKEQALTILLVPLSTYLSVGTTTPDNLPRKTQLVASYGHSILQQS